jgi:hypothetical protein
MPHEIHSQQRYLKHIGGATIGILDICFREVVSFLFVRGRRGRRIVVVAALVAIAAAGTWWVLGERSSVAGLRYWSDIGALDEYAGELTIVMGRAYGRGSDPQRYPRMVDGPGPGIETLEVDQSPGGETVVVLRLRRDRPVREWFPTGETYEISACYRWVFGRGTDTPERLSSCPTGRVIELDPPPVIAELPDGIDDALYEALAPLAGQLETSEEMVAQAVRSAYAAAERSARAVPGADPDAILSGDDILAGNDWIDTVDGAIGVAIGRDRSCVMARVVPDDVRVERPAPISLEPGEVGCSAAWAARGIDRP